MFKAKCNNGDLIFGLSKENITRLMNGEPIAFNLNKMGLEDRRVIICYGETEDKIYEDLVDMIDLKNTKINDSPPYTMIQGVYIEDEWKQFSDYPNPPDEPEVPTTASFNQWEAYRKELEQFSIKHKLQ